MGVRVFVPDIPEFAPLIEGARKAGGCTIEPPSGGYWTIAAQDGLRFERKALGLGPALWNSALCGGFEGRITQYDRDVMNIVPDNG